MTFDELFLTLGELPDSVYAFEVIIDHNGPMNQHETIPGASKLTTAIIDPERKLVILS